MRMHQKFQVIPGNTRKTRDELYDKTDETGIRHVKEIKMAKPQIIIVEDELIIAQEIKQFLIRMDYQVPATASYGEDALKKIAAIKPDLVLMDIKLKGEMNGIEAAGKAHALYDIPVVYMTANADQDTVARAKQTEAYGFVYKPVQPDVLRAVIEMALYKHNIEKQVKEREAWLGATLQSIGDAVIATDTHGKITFMNGVAETLTGWKQQECKSKPLQDVFHIINKKTRKPVTNPVTRALQQGSQVGLANHTILIARDGTEYQIADSASPIRNTRDEIIGVVLVFRDVTKDYQMQETIQENEHKYRNLFDASASVIGVYEAIDNGDDFIFKDFNRSGEKIEKIKRAEIIGKSVKQRYPDIVESGLFDVFRQVWQTGKPQQYLVTICKNNKIFNWRDTLVYKLQSGDIVAVYNDVTDRMLAEKNLQSNEENLRITLNSIGDAVIATDTLGRITRMNPVAEALTGWSLDDAKGKSLNTVFKIINSKTRKKVPNPVNKVMKTDKIVGLANHTTLIAKDSKEYQIADSAAPIKDAHGATTGVVLVFRDVTKDYQMREKIAESEKKYADLFNSSLSGIALHKIVLDETGEPVDYIYLEANSAFEKLTGLQVQNIIGKKVTEVIPEIEKDNFIHTYGKVALSGKPITFEQYAPGIDKYYKINAFSPRKGQFATIFIDVTENKRAEQALLTERRRLADILKGTNVGTWEWNVQSGEIIFNDRWAEMIGYTSKELYPVTFTLWEKLIHPQDLKFSNELLARHLNGELDYYECELRMRHKNGQWVWVLDRGRIATRANDGKPLLVSGTHQDITERKRAEEVITRERQQLLSIFNSIDEMIYIADPQTYEILYVNQKLASLLNKDCIGGICYKEFQGLDSPCPFCTNDIILKQKPQPVKWVFHNENLNKDFEIVDRIIEWSDGREVRFELAIDITERKRTEQALQASEARYRNIFNNSIEGIYQSTIEGKFRTVNPAFARMLGYDSPEEVINNVTNINEQVYITPGDRQKLLEKMFSSESTIKDYEIQFKKKDGSVFWVALNAHIVRNEKDDSCFFEGSCMDITERKKNQETLRLNEAIFSSFLEHSPVYVFFKDKDIRAIRLSRNYEQLLGMPINQALGKTLDELIPSDLSKSIVANDLQVLHEGKCVKIIEELNGQIYETTKFPILKDGLPFMLAGFTIDITERTKTEEQVRKNLLEKEVMLKEIHHRVKNNMNVITSLLHLQAKRIETKEQALAAFEESRNRIFSMALVHEQLYKSDDLSKIDMKNYIESISLKLKQNSTVDKHITTELKVNNIFLEVTHAIPCGLILNELLTNIYKHAFTDKKQGKIIISFKQPAENEYELIVKDNGKGLQEDIDFQNINTLGLQLVKLLTDQIGGSLHVHRNSGTTFTIRFKVTNGQK